MTSPGAPLPWPPPGLEALRGRLHTIARRLGVANLFLLGAVAGFSVGWRASVSAGPAGSAGSAIACAALALIGSLALLSAALNVWTTVREGGMNVWRGYTWLTIIEVMADGAGDTGALIAGTDAFAHVPPDTRTSLRIARVVSGMARFGAGLLPLPLFFLQSAIGADGSGGMALSFAIAVIPSLILLAFASVAGSTESTALRPYRDAQRKRFARRADAIKIADDWYGSFETARQGQSVGRGPAGGVLRAWAAGGVVAFGIIGVTLTFVPVWLIAGVGSASPFAGLPVFANSMDRVERYEYLRAYTPPLDTTITPERAGAAFHALAGTQNATPYLKPVAETLVPFPPRGDTLFRDNARGYSGWGGPRSPNVLDFAKKGLTPAQRDYLAAVANNKLWEWFSTVARSRRADLAGGRFILPFPADLSPMAVPMTKFAATRDLAYANTARAAYHLANGNVWEADRVIRETIGFGFHLIDDGYSPIDPLMGAIVVGEGHDALLKLYTITNNPNLANFRAYESASKSSASVYPSDPDHVLNNRSTPRGIRLDILEARQMKSCASVRALLFGPSAQEQRELKSLRAQIARSPAEEAVFDLSIDVLNRPMGPSARAGAGGAVLLFAAKISGALLRSPRIPNCAALLAASAAFGGPRR